MEGQVSGPPSLSGVNYFRVEFFFLIGAKNFKINKSIGDDMELTLKQFKGAIKEDKQIYKKGG
jgi:hypothetical protein